MECEHLTRLMINTDEYRLVIQWVESEDRFRAALEQADWNGHFREIDSEGHSTIEYAIDALNEYLGATD